MSQPIHGGLQIAPAVYIFSGAGDPNLLVTVTNSGAINARVKASEGEALADVEATLYAQARVLGFE